MFLREVVLNGFKSFADRTRLAMQPGVTAIVGPNGCGKSNIVDAIRWVLGEQSAKALRGGKMEDVIFQGTDQRKALPVCEVSLTFTDCEKELGTAFHEVEISRRVARDGGGEYFLNGKQCRLKDIHRLFMDTGVGRVSYSFMAQGQIDAILSANPAERRSIFEEAAGITRYKSQRREALNKLALVEQNLARATDVIEEVARQIGTLKRQAGKALRYQRLKHRLTKLDLAHNAFFFARRQAEIARLDGLAANLRASAEEVGTALRGREERVAALKADRAAVHQKLQDTQQAVFDLRSEKENADNQAQFADVRREDLEGRIAEIEREITGLREQLAALDARLSTDSASKRGALDTVGSSDEKFRKHQAGFDAALAALDKAERDLQSHRQHLLMLESGITRLRSNSTSFEVDLKTYQVKHAALADAVFQLNEERNGLESQRGQYTVAREARGRDLAAAQQTAAAAQAAENELRQKFRDTQARIQDLDRKVARGAAHLQALEGLQARFEGFAEGAKAILRGELEAELPKGSYHILTKIVEIEDDAASAIEALLGPAADALALADFTAAGPVAARLASEKLGRACLLAPAPARTAANAPAPLPVGVRPALDAVSVRDGQSKMRAHIESLLGRCYLAQDLGEFLAYWAAHPDFDFDLAATPAGEVVDRRGLVFGGAGKSKENSFLRRESDIRKQRKELTSQNEELTAATEAAMKLQAELDAAEAVIAEKRARAAEIAQEAATIHTQEKTLGQSLAQNADAIARQRRQLEELEQSRSDAEQRLIRAQADLGDAEGKISSEREAIAAVEQNIAKLRAERDRLQEKLGEARFELAEKRQRLQVLDRGLDELEAQRRDLDARLLRRAQEVDATREQIAELEQTAAAQRARAAQLQTSLAAATQSLETDRQASLRLEAEIKNIEDSLSGERGEQRAREAELHAHEVKLAEERSQCAFLDDKVRAEHQLDIRALDWKRELWLADEQFETRVRLDDLEEEGAAEITPRAKRERGDPAPADLAAMDNTDWEPLIREIKDLRERLAGLGAVNLVAIEEYAALKERHDFLKTQSDDLWKSKNDLVQAIDEINQTSQQLFQDTFEQVRKNFKFTFNKLFGGGEADLQLVQAEDVLDSGVDIVARPPGTKLRSLSLLSGGQKTMTAVGLLFAIYMVKPSPFCVLDELDAPLDDANIGRFTGMLRDFTRYSQFLIVTHNKRTIAASNTIYGVTMPERGVTRMVSMKLDHSGEAIEHATVTAPAPASPPPSATATASAPSQTASPSAAVAHS